MRITLKAKEAANNQTLVFKYVRSNDWLVIWSSNNETAFFERTGSHDELFR